MVLKDDLITSATNTLSNIQKQQNKRQQLLNEKSCKSRKTKSLETKHKMLANNTSHSQKRQCKNVKKDSEFVFVGIHSRYQYGHLLSLWYIYFQGFLHYPTKQLKQRIRIRFYSRRGDHIEHERERNAVVINENYYLQAMDMYRWVLRINNLYSKF